MLSLLSGARFKCVSDVLTPAQRSLCMSRIRSRDSRPERTVRSILHRMRYRFRLHRRDLPGKPDIVLPKINTVIFVHGCFWHMHRCRYGRVRPQTRAHFWETKRRGNVQRDRRNLTQLREAGWNVLTIWECHTRDLNDLARRLERLLPERTSDTIRTHADLEPPKALAYVRH